MKKVLVVLSCISLLALMFSMTACGHEHELTRVEAVASTCESNGNTEYYSCECGKYFSDSEGKTEIEESSWVTAKTGHDYQSDISCEIENGKAYSVKTCVCGDTEKTEILNAVIVTPETVQKVLNGENGSIDNKVIVFAKGEYTQTLYLGIPNKHVGSNTIYKGIQANATELTTFTDIEDIKKMSWGSKYYSRSMENIKFISEENVVLPGIEMSSGHVYGNVFDYVIDKQYTSGSAYYLSLDVKNLTFEGLTFNKRINFVTSATNIYYEEGTDKEELLLAASLFDGITFEGCNFDMGGTESTVGSAIRLYSESSVDISIKNIVVNNCEISNAYQGVYTNHVQNISVKNTNFSNLGHNAIAIQNHGKDNYNHGEIKIEANTFNDISDRIIRFNQFFGSLILIKNNTASNCGNTNNEVIKAEGLKGISEESEIEYNISDNNWGENAVVYNLELKDK